MVIGGVQEANMKLIYRLILTFNSTFWTIVIYGVKCGWSFIGNKAVTAFVLALIPILFSGMTILLSRWFLSSKDEFPECNTISLADHEFLSVYLGYFFVALSIPDNFTLIFVYILVYSFSFLSQTQYFNPILLLFGYHFYHLHTVSGTEFFVISHGKVFRSLREINIGYLRRINDSTYIACKEISNG